MDEHTVLIADSSEEFCNSLSQILRWNCRVRMCSRGRRALKLIQELRPDVLVLDLMLPEMDGISLLRTLTPSDCRPAILATTNLVTSYILEQAQNLEVDYLLCKPCSILATAARVQELLLRQEQENQPKDLRHRVTELLLMLGVSVKLHGYKYLREAILLMIEDPNQSLTKELYPQVAVRCGSAATHVERSIRGAIQDAWSHQDPRIWLLYFQPDGMGNAIRPTNAVFISRLADGLRSPPSYSQEPPEFVPGIEL